QSLRGRARSSPRDPRRRDQQAVPAGTGRRDEPHRQAAGAVRLWLVAGRGFFLQAEPGELRRALTMADETEPKSLRDELAAMAMVAYIREFSSYDYTDIADYAYKMADAMLARREVQEQG